MVDSTGSAPGFNSRRGLLCTAGERRGVTIVVMAIVIVVMFSFTALAVDLGRAYVTQAELQTSADAAALAGAVELRDQPAVDVNAILMAVTAVANANRVQGAQPVVGSVELGYWNDFSGNFASAPLGADTIHAVRVRTSHSLGYTFARVMGADEVNLSTSAVAAIGYPRFIGCVRPWALSYNSMPVDDPFTAEDYDALTANMAIVAFEVGSGPSTDPDVMIPVELESGSNYAQAIRECSSDSIRVGSTVESSGAPISATNAAVRELCEADGSPVFTCNNRVVKVVIYDSANPPEYSVRFVGAFTITCYNTGTDADADILGTCDGVTPAQIGDPEVARIFGRFTTMVDVLSTGFSLTPSPIRGPVALVQ